MFKKKKNKIEPPKEQDSVHINKGLLIFCLILLALIIVLSAVLTTVLK